LVSRAEADAILAMPKFADPPGEWVDRQNNGNQREMVFGVTDASGRTAEGLLVTLRVNAGRRIASKYWAFGIMRLDGRFASQRVYMLEILDPTKLGHQDEREGRIYGTHERVGPDTVPLDPEMYRWNFGDSLNWYLQRVSLDLSDTIPNPFELQLR
jgi:hypothetical protein